MATITDVTARYSRKVQLDDFEPIQHSVELEAELADGDSADAVYDELAEAAEDMVERQLASRIAKKKLSEDSDDE